MGKGPKILIIDIETAPCEGYFWSTGKQYVGPNQIKKGADSYMLCYSAKWLDSQKVLFDSIIKYPETFRLAPKSDEKIAQSLHKLIDKADVVVAYNGNAFDLKWFNTLCIKYSLPPVDYKAIDAYKAYRNLCRLSSYKLDFISRKFFDDYKLDHEGLELWLKCMAGSRTAFKKMRDYNEKDVLLLEQAYLKIKPYMKDHPNLALYTEDASLKCTRCAGSNITRQGYCYTKVGVYQRYKCLDCGRWLKDNKNLINSNSVLRDA